MFISVITNMIGCDIFFLITIFPQQIRTRGVTPFLPRPVSADSSVLKMQGMQVLSQIFYVSYRMKLLDLSSKNHVLISQNTLTLNAHT